jgi:LuxR family maltose regulon positive regulatory protein
MHRIKMDLFLQTKLTVPIIRDRLVARSGLFQRLEDGLLQEGQFQRKLTLVAAPAGYGKTTLIADWLRLAIAR